MKAIRAQKPELEYRAVQPDRWTFRSDKIREWVESWCKGRVLNACAGKTHLQLEDVVRNDINPKRDADHHEDVADLSDVLGADCFDTIVFDPPFSENQADESYEGHNIENTAAVMRVFHRMLRPGGRVVQMGFTTTCMPAKLGYVRRAVCVFNTLGRQADWLGTVDERVNGDVTQYSEMD